MIRGKLVEHLNEASIVKPSKLIDLSVCSNEWMVDAHSGDIFSLFISRYMTSLPLSCCRYIYRLLLHTLSEARHARTHTRQQRPQREPRNLAGAQREATLCTGWASYQGQLCTRVPGGAQKAPQEVRVFRTSKKTGGAFRTRQF